MAEVFLSGALRVTYGDDMVTLELVNGEAVQLVTALSRREALDLGCLLTAFGCGQDARAFRYLPSLSS